MKAEELMIGDWVMFDGELKQVQEVLFDTVTIDCWPKDIEDISPIPLTAEILEKNGFVLIDEKDKYYRWESAEGVYINVDFKSEEPWVSINNTCYSAIPVCRYVHQLQHALKMCGINKEIEL